MILTSLRVAPANVKAAEMSCRNRFRCAAVDMGFERVRPAGAWMMSSTSFGRKPFGSDLIKTRWTASKPDFEAFIAPHCRAKFRSRGKRHGHNQWQKDHAKAVDHPPTLSRWQNDEIFRASQVAIGWTETYVKYFDYLTAVDIKHDAPHRQRNRYENMIFMRSDDPDSQAGPLWKREDYKTSTSALMCLQQEQGKGMPHIPMPMRTRQHNTLDRRIQQNLEPADALLNTDFILFFVMVTKFDMFILAS